MAIKFISVKCPDCGATLDVEEGRQQIYCSYCGAKVMIQNDNEYIYRNIDEASIKQTEAEAMLRMRELELEEKENERSRKGRRIAYIVAAVFVVVGLIAMQFTESGMFALYAILAGALIAEFTFIGNSNKKKKVRHVISSTEAQITEKMEEYSGKNYNSIAALYRAAGFTNVTVVPLCDLNVFTSKKNGQVDDITINGESEFEEGEIFSKSADVTITYHSLR